MAIIKTRMNQETRTVTTTITVNLDDVRMQTPVPHIPHSVSLLRAYEQVMHGECVSWFEHPLERDMLDIVTENMPKLSEVTQDILSGNPICPKKVEEESGS